jgi:hypothetical protein
MIFVSKINRSLGLALKRRRTHSCNKKNSCHEHCIKIKPQNFEMIKAIDFNRYNMKISRSMFRRSTDVFTGTLNPEKHFNVHSITRQIIGRIFRTQCILLGIAKVQNPQTYTCIIDSLTIFIRYIIQHLA